MALQRLWAGPSTAIGYPAFQSTASTVPRWIADYLLIALVCLFAVCFDVVGGLPGHVALERLALNTFLLCLWLPFELHSVLPSTFSVGWLVLQSVLTVVAMFRSWDARRAKSQQAAQPQSTAATALAISPPLQEGGLADDESAAVWRAAYIDVRNLIAIHFNRMSVNEDRDPLQPPADWDPYNYQYLDDNDDGDRKRNHISYPRLRRTASTISPPSLVDPNRRIREDERQRQQQQQRRQQQQQQQPAAVHPPPAAWPSIATSPAAAAAGFIDDYRVVTLTPEPWLVQQFSTTGSLLHDMIVSAAASATPAGRKVELDRVVLKEAVTAAADRLICGGALYPSHHASMVRHVHRAICRPHNLKDDRMPMYNIPIYNFVD